MIYPDSIEEKLGFDHVKQKIQSLCKTDSSRTNADQISFQSDLDQLYDLLNPVDEFLKLIDQGIGLPALFDSDLTNVLGGISVQGNFLEGDELIRVARILRGFEAWNTFLKKEHETCPFLLDKVSGVVVGHSLSKEIESRIEESGGVKDSASDQLRKVRKDLRSAMSSARNSLSRIFRETEKKGYVPDGLNISVRDGRLVIPVLAEHKRHIKGLIHDESASGQTAYVEPAEVLELNNRIRELQIEERKEVVKVLISLTDSLRVNKDALDTINQVIGEIDLAHAKARYAIQIEGIVPKFGKVLKLENARHPVLLDAFRESNRKVVPLSLELSNELRMLLISGPNAGGKSVCLKTTGLLQYMAQSGIPVPVDEDSEFRIFSSVFVDMGDEQSIENDLSTYSSHLTNLNTMLRYSDKNSLILIDEFGTGTDPQFGGALAQAVLEGLLGTGTFGVITTHYSNLKEYAERTEGIQNGSMRYDTDNLAPLFKLDIGKPGNSFAFEIAGNIGLPESIIDAAKNLAGTDHVSLEQLIGKLTQEREELEEKLRDVGSKESKLSKLTEDYESLKSDLESRKNLIVNRAKEEAESLLKDANREIEKTIRHIRENQAHKAETKKARERLGKVKTKVEKKVKVKSKEVSEPVIKGPVEVGDIVTLKDGSMKGEVLSIKNGVAELSVGSLKTTLKVKDLKKIGSSKSKVSRPQKRGVDIINKKAYFKSELDLRGKRAEAAVMEVDKFIDDALLSNMKEVRILHGKGDGILREVVRTHLRDYPYIGSMRDAHIEQGGAGITVIELK